jgi:SAM-dependent methyltransferase
MSDKDARRALGHRFSADRMAENYRFRPPYPAEVYETLLELIRGHPRVLLDAGCGTGKITLGLIDQIDRADAVDPSAAMLQVARSLPGASSAKIKWIQAAIEDAPLDPPYGLIVAASSIHWMDLERTLPRFADALAAGAMLAVLDGDARVDAPWERGETDFMIDFVTAGEGQGPKWWKTVRERFRRAGAGASAVRASRASNHCACFIFTEHRRLSPLPAFARDVVGRSSRRKGISRVRRCDDGNPETPRSRRDAHVQGADANRMGALR